jgi:predicted adenylyl cyclase CyaB
MKEIEAKILEVDAAQVKARLKALGAVCSFDDEMHAIYYDAPDHSLSQRQTTLRLRKEGGNAVLAVKKKDLAAPAGIKIADEIETIVSDFALTQQLLQMLGYEVILEMHKHRQQHELGNTHVVIDRYMEPHAHVPPFIEIEAQDVATLHLVAQQLGFHPSQCVSLNSAELLQKYAPKG